MNDKYTAQLEAYRYGVWQEMVSEKSEPEPLTSEQYIFTGTVPSKRDPEKGEITCPVCNCAGKEKVLDDRVRIYHPGRLIPCRAPKGYLLQNATLDRLVPA